MNSRFHYKTSHSRFLTTRRYQVSILFFNPSWKSSHLSGLDTNTMILSHHHIVFLDTAWRATERRGGVQPRSPVKRRCRDFDSLAISENKFLVWLMLLAWSLRLGWVLFETNVHIQLVWLMLLAWSLRLGWVLFGTNVHIQLNPVYKAFHRIRCCGNETNCV